MSQRSRCAISVALGALWLAVPAPALAHTEVRPTPDTLWTAWEPDPFLAAGLFLAVWLYLRGTGALWRRAGTGRGVRRWQVWSFIGGVAMLAVASFSPLDALGGALFSAHMVQHLIVFLIAPLLLAAGRPALAVIWALPVSWRNAIGRWASTPPLVGLGAAVNHWITVLMLYAGVLWLWHVPSLYDAALESQLVHGVEHLSFVVVSLMFWSRVVEAGRPSGIGHGTALLMVFATALHSSALGALLTFADMPLYISHHEHVAPWGLTVLEDQQLAGVIMWVPMGLWLTVAGLVVFGLWVRAADRSVRRLEHEQGVTQRPGLAGAGTAAPGRSGS